mgnify:FL=1
MISEISVAQMEPATEFGVDGFISKISVARSLSDLLNSATEPHQMNTG